MITTRPDLGLKYRFCLVEELLILVLKNHTYYL
jgi:hypothetical protein